MSSRDRLACVLVLCLFWGFIAALLGEFYWTGVQVGRDPAKFAYVHWYDWLAVALLPLIVVSLVGVLWTAFGPRGSAE